MDGVCTQGVHPDAGNNAPTRSYRLLFLSRPLRDAVTSEREFFPCPCALRSSLKSFTSRPTNLQGIHRIAAATGGCPSTGNHHFVEVVHCGNQLLKKPPAHMQHIDVAWVLPHYQAGIKEQNTRQKVVAWLTCCLSLASHLA